MHRNYRLLYRQCALVFSLGVAGGLFSPTGQYNMIGNMTVQKPTKLHHSSLWFHYNSHTRQNIAHLTTW